MTHVVEHKIFRYSWELVRHTYLVDLGNEIDIQQVEISPSHEGRFLPRPYPRTSFFEAEIDQIQKGGKTVFSFRNICPVEICQKPDWNPFNLVRKSGNLRIIRRFQSQEGETEIRWLYTDDFFLISLSSGDRHDLDMLISLIIGKLNMIALSVQSGKRIRSEFEHQQQYRADMSTMFSKGVDGAFRDVPVYQQHGEMAGSDIDVSAALMSAEFQDLNASVAAGWNAVAESPDSGSPPALAAANGTPAEEAGPEIPGAEPHAPEYRVKENTTTADTSADESIPSEPAAGDRTGAASISAEGSIAEIIPESDIPLSDVLERVRENESSPATTARAPQEEIPQGIPPLEKPPDKNAMPEKMCGNCGAGISDTTKFCGSCGSAVGRVPHAEEPVPAGRTCDSCGAGVSDTTKFCGNCGSAVGRVPLSEEPVPAGRTCDSCGAGISDTTKFCGHCGSAVGSTVLPTDQMPVGAGMPSDGSNTPSPARQEPAAVNLKSIKELEDLSWLSD
jgi:RNA polymerase subunit RPABC4/transcription elongation factor Spt4